MSAIEALYLFDEHNTPLLEHTFTGRPPASSTLLPLYLAHASPRPSLLYLPSTNPPTLLYSLVQDQLLFLCPCATDTEPLQVLEFLHRVADVLEDFLGAPLLAAQIEANYHVVAQLLAEMVDGGVIACTEPNALRDVVEAPSFIKTLLGGVGLPGSTPSSLAPSAMSASQAPSAVPWRKTNVRHTSNEMYVDIVETLHVTMAPSGRPLSAMANGSIAFTAKVSGVPDLLLQVGCPGGIHGTVALPVFHPCVRLSRWKERPGELSFVPPDGRFVLAGYEVDLLGPAALDAFSAAGAKSLHKLNIPATVSVTPSLGPTGSEFEVKLQLNPRFAGNSSTTTTASMSKGGGIGGGLGYRGLSNTAFTSTLTGTTASPAIEEMVVHIPLPAKVKTLTDLRLARGTGDASYAPGDSAIEWRLSSREVNALLSQDRGGGAGASATLRATVVGTEEDATGGDTLDGGGPVIFSPSLSTYDYDDDTSRHHTSSDATGNTGRTAEGDEKRKKANKILMPSCATLSFSVKGWLPSGIKVEGLNVDPKRSKGLGSGVTPYKGVKYLCVSRKGVECRC